MNSVFIRFTWLLVLTSFGNCLHCVSHGNAEIDWYVVYKLPWSESTVPRDSYFYMDDRLVSFQLYPKPFNDTDQPVFNTLQQIYQLNMSGPDVLYFMYNNEPPNQASDTKQKQLRWPYIFGHSNGVVGFNATSGFWMVHSMPKFPAPREDKIAATEPMDSPLAQIFFCVTMSTALNLDEIGLQLLYIQPSIYDLLLPLTFEAKYPHVGDVLNGKAVASPPWSRETSFRSRSGATFMSFVKFWKYNIDLYGGWLATRLGNSVMPDSLLVHTWQNDSTKLCSNCSGTNKVYNVQVVGFSDPEVQIGDLMDGSKWSVTNSSNNPWTCFADTDREMSQTALPGGALCTDNKHIWQNFRGLVSEVTDCGHTSDCIPNEGADIVKIKRYKNSTSEPSK